MSALSLFGSTPSISPRDRDRFGFASPFFDGLERSFRALRSEFDFAPGVELHRDGDDLELSLELPGVDPEKDVKLQLRDGKLIISGERRQETKEKGYTEFSYGSFSRTIGLHPGVTEDQVTANYDSGVLHVRVAGAYRDQSPSRSIPISTEKSGQSQLEEEKKSEEAVENATAAEDTLTERG